MERNVGASSKRKLGRGLDIIPGGGTWRPEETGKGFRSLENKGQSLKSILFDFGPVIGQRSCPRYPEMREKGVMLANGGLSEGWGRRNARDQQNMGMPRKREIGDGNRM